MKLLNHTHYETAALRRLFAAGLRHLEGQSAGKVVEVVYSRGDPTFAVTGWANYGNWGDGWGKGRVGQRNFARVLHHGTHMRIRVPKDPALLDLAELARVWEHEVLHTLGLRHRSMSPRQMLRDPKPWAVPAWAAGLTVPVQIVKKAAPDERRAAARAERERHARAMLATWERKLATAEKRVAAWRTKVRRYERSNK